MGEESARAEADPLGGRGGRRTIMQMVVVGLIASVLGIALGLIIDWFPTQGSTQAEKIDTFWDVLIICSVPFFVLVTTVVLFAALRVPHAAGRGAPRRPADPRQHAARGRLDRRCRRSSSSRSAPTPTSTLHDIEKAPAKALGVERQVTVNGQQFTWTFDYNEGGKKFSSAQLYVPEGRSVKFNVKTKDVLHDFWVPAWRMKIDAVPGITTNYRVTPTKPGHLAGRLRRALRPRPRLHAPDRARRPQADFDKWVTKMTTRTAAPAPAAGGTAGGGAGPRSTPRPCSARARRPPAPPPAAPATSSPTRARRAASAPTSTQVLKGKDEAFIKQSIVDPNAVDREGLQREHHAGQLRQAAQRGRAGCARQVPGGGGGPMIAKVRAPGWYRAAYYMLVAAAFSLGISAG